MRIVITGASGNVGTALVERLSQDPKVQSIVGLVRRSPDWHPPRTTWTEADVATDDLDQVFAGADAVVHLAWLFQPTHDPILTWRSNVEGSVRVFAAAAEAGVRTIVYASSVGAYSPGPQDRPVDENWPTHGWPTAGYTREKAYVERSSTRSNATIPTSGWFGCARGSSSSTSPRPRSGGCSPGPCSRPGSHDQV